MVEKITTSEELKEYKEYLKNNHIFVPDKIYDYIDYLEMKVGQCEKDPISDYCMSYDDTTDGVTDDDGHPIDDSVPDNNKMYRYVNGHLEEVEPNFEYDNDGVEDILTDHPDSLKEGMIIYHCWVFGKAWFKEWFINYDEGKIQPANLLNRPRWHTSFKSTVHKDENGFYVYPNDDATREKFYKFGIDSTSRIV